MSRALASARVSRDEGGNGSDGEGGAEPDVGDPGRSHAASGSTDPPPAETSAGDLGRWANDDLRRIEGPLSDQAGGDDDEATTECRAAAALLLPLWIQGDGGTGAIAALARWIPAHMSHRLARGQGRPISWQWRLMTIAWMVEQCGIHTLVGSNRQLALAHIEALGFPAAAGRSLPIVGWATGRASAAPGVNIPGMRHRNPLIIDTAGGHRGGDAERLLERVVRRIEGCCDDHRADEGPGGDRGDRGHEDVTRREKVPLPARAGGVTAVTPRPLATSWTGRASNSPAQDGGTSALVVRIRTTPAGTPATRETQLPASRPTAARPRVTGEAAS